MLTYKWIPKNRWSFLAYISSGFNDPVSNFLSRPAFSFICAPSCSCVNPFFIRASRINFANSGFRIVLSVMSIFFIGPVLLLEAEVLAEVMDKEAVGLVLAMEIGGVYGLPRFEHPLQTLNAIPSINTVFFSSITLRPHNSQNEDNRI